MGPKLNPKYVTSTDTPVMLTCRSYSPPSGRTASGLVQDTSSPEVWMDIGQLAESALHGGGRGDDEG